MNRLHIIELTGPLIDDGGGFARTLHDVLAESGLQLRGVPDLTEGSAPGHAVRTILGGHGRDDDREAIERLAGEVLSRWARLGASRECRIATGAADWVARRIRLGGRVAVVSNLPSQLTETLLARVGLPDLPVATGDRELPHPDPIMTSMAAHGVRREETVVVARSPAVLLAATQAGVAEVVLLGPGGSRWEELVPVTSRIAALSELPDPS